MLVPSLPVPHLHALPSLLYPRRSGCAPPKATPSTCALDSGPFLLSRALLQQMSLLLPVSLMFPYEIQTFCNFSNLRKNHPPPPLALRPHAAAPLYVKFLRKVVYIHCLYLFLLSSSPPPHLLFLKKSFHYGNSKHRHKWKGQHGSPHVLISQRKPRSSHDQSCFSSTNSNHFFAFPHIILKQILD